MSINIKKLFVMVIAGPILASCNNGSSSSNTNPPQNPTQVYISVFGDNKLQQCSLSSDNLFACPDNPPLSSNLLKNPAGNAIYNGNIYISNSAFGNGDVSNVVRCPISNGNIDMASCSIANSANIGLNHPIGLTILNKKAYMANWGDANATTKPTYTYCDINDNDAQLSNCSSPQIGSTGMPDTGTPEQIAFYLTQNNTYKAYITDQQDDGYAQCDVLADGSLSNCNFNQLVQGASGDAVPTGPRGMLFYNGFAYFVNSGYHNGQKVANTVSSYTMCNVDNNSGNLNGCNTYKDASGLLLNSPTGISQYNGYIYITNEDGPGYSYSRCTSSTTGVLTNCQTFFTSGSITPTNPVYTYMSFSN